MTLHMVRLCLCILFHLLEAVHWQSRVVLAQEQPLNLDIYRGCSRQWQNWHDPDLPVFGVGAERDARVQVQNHRPR